MAGRGADRLRFAFGRAPGAETVIEAVRRQANAIDSAIPILRTRTMEQNVDSNILQERLVATLAGFFGLLALLLAAVGLYGVMAHSVARRTREIGIRMALGAAGRAVLWMVLRDALVMVTVGAAIGIPAALALAKFASSLLFGIAAGDPFNALMATLFLGGVAVVASYLAGAASQPHRSWYRTAVSVDSAALPNHEQGSGVYSRMHSLASDLRYAARELRRRPGFTLTAVLSLALGVGATSAVFSVIYAVLINPFPYVGADRMMQLASRTRPASIAIRG